MYNVKLTEESVTKMINGQLSSLSELGVFTHGLWSKKDIDHLCEIKNWPTITLEDATNIFELHNVFYGGNHAITWRTLADITKTYLIKQELMEPEYS